MCWGGEGRLGGGGVQMKVVEEEDLGVAFLRIHYRLSGIQSTSSKGSLFFPFLPTDFRDS